MTALLFFFIDVTVVLPPTQLIRLGKFNLETITTIANICKVNEEKKPLQENAISLSQISRQLQNAD